MGVTGRRLLAIGLVLAFGCDSGRETPTGPATSKVDTPEQQPLRGDAPFVGAWRTEGPVSVRLRSRPQAVAAGETFDLSVDFRVEPMWEIHSVGSDPTPGATRLELTLPNEVTASEEWHLPVSSPSASPTGGRVYAGNFTVSRAMITTAASPRGEKAIVCRVSFQACNPQQCLRPCQIRLESALLVK